MKTRTQVAAKLLISCYAILLPVVLFFTYSPNSRLGNGLIDFTRLGSYIAAYMVVQILAWVGVLYKQSWAWWIIVLLAVAHPVAGAAITLGLYHPGIPLPQFLTSQPYDLFELGVLLVLLTDRSALKKKTTKRRKRISTTARRRTTSATRRSTRPRRTRRRRESDYYYD